MTPPSAPPRQTLVIPGWVPPPVANGSRQKHWATVRKQVEQVKTMAWASAKHAGWQKVEGRAKLTIVMVFPVSRRRDVDNNYARVKHLVDGLKPWIVDDSSDWLDLHVHVEVRKGEKATELILEHAA